MKCRTVASDLDEPTDANDNDLEFEGSLGTAVMLGIGLDMGGGMQLGLEGSFIGHNFNEEDVTYDSTEYESEASATSLGAMITTAYQVDPEQPVLRHADGGARFLPQHRQW